MEIKNNLQFNRNFGCKNDKSLEMPGFFTSMMSVWKWIQNRKKYRKREWEDMWEHERDLITRAEFLYSAMPKAGQTSVLFRDLIKTFWFIFIWIWYGYLQMREFWLVRFKLFHIFPQIKSVSYSWKKVCRIYMSYS